MPNLSSAFIRLVGRAAEGLSSTLRLWCDVCQRQTVFKLIDDAGGYETYKCESCRIVTHTYAVK